MNKLPSVDSFDDRRSWEKACWKILLADRGSLERIITEREKSDLVRRVAVAQELMAGAKYRDIGAKLWISPQTISAINKSLKESGYISYHSRKERVSRKDSYPKKRSKRRVGTPHRHKYGTIYY
jgi:uncharacterized protein YerC